MIVLGIDTATGATAVALAADGVSELRDDPPAGAHPGHATRLLGMAEELLAGAGLGWEALELIAVGVGPGTFTGLRVGIATARGLAQSREIALVGVSSSRALAHAALASGARERGVGDAVLAVIDARRSEVFAAAYARAADGVVELAAPRAIAPQRIGEVLIEAAPDGEHRRSWLGVGDGALRYAEELRGAGVALAPERSPLHRVAAAAICELGVRGDPAPLGTGVLPDYRRQPDAELTLAARAGV